MEGLDLRPAIAVAVPAAAAALTLLFGDRPRLREGASFLAPIATCAVLASMVPEVLAGSEPATALITLAPGFRLGLTADAFGMLFALLASGLWVLTALYNVGYLRATRERHQTSYYACFALCVAAAVGIALAANLITLFIFYEVLTLATYPLVAHKRTPEAITAARKYLAYTLGAGQVLLLAIVATAVLAPGADLRPGGFLAGTASDPALWVLFVLFMIGCGVKAALMPLHAWLPAAMVAPTPVSALLHAVAVVKAGTFACVRVVGWVFGVDLMRDLGADLVLATAAAVTILVASVRALGESNLKRRLAYSTVGQLSYIVLGAGLGSAAALAGGMFHMAAHGLLKITLFFCAGSIYVRTGKTEIPALEGIGRTMPATMAAFTIGALGLTGMPALAGFVGKWQLGLGSLDAGHGVFVGVLVASGLLNAAYFLPIVHGAFFGGSGGIRFDEAPPALWIPLAVTAAASIAIGVAPGAALPFYELAWQAARAVVAGGTS
ncbi:MAG TPA: proton-conducting transporter membrane subunit [Thermoanaerobaculia bacterium]|nr:proton-conducting transporter membrane subunit [Thermoanaerobaculia bacterium]